MAAVCSSALRDHLSNDFCAELVEEVRWEDAMSHPMIVITNDNGDYHRHEWAGDHLRDLV